jgi:hypothetical protein
MQVPHSRHPANSTAISFFFGEGVKVCRAGINAESLSTGVTDLLIKKDMGLFIVLKDIEGQLFDDLHRRRPSFIISFTPEALGSPSLCGQKALHFSES